VHRCNALLQCVSLLLLAFALSAQSHAATHVFYFTNGCSTTGSTVATYKVSPTTGIPAQVGTPLSLPNAQSISSIVATPNDHFIYVMWSDSNSQSHLWAYTTDSSGVPSSTPVQKLSSQGWGQLFIHKSGKFAYVLKTTSGNNGYSSKLYLYHINQTTGVLTQDPTIQATYGPDYFSLESLISFNKAGTRLYDDSGVHFHDTDSDTYSYHPVSETTGQLSPDVGTYFAVSGYADQQYFTTNYILNLHNDGAGPSVLNVYPNKKNPAQPLFTCTQSMLSACGDAMNYWISVDEKYVFLPDNTANDVVIGHIDGTNKVITETASITGVPFLYFAPDDLLIYGVDGTNGIVQVYLFNSATGSVTSGGSITFNPAKGYGIFPATRQ